MTIETRPALEGYVVNIVDHGTIVQVWVRTDDGGLKPVNFDHRSFAILWEREGNIIGRDVAFHRDDEPWLEVL